MRILLADDESTIRVTLADDLRDAGHDVVVAVDGLRAVERIGDIHFDVVIADLVMPGLGGLEVLQRARARDPDTRVLLISADGTAEARVRALSAGAAAYFSKPFMNQDVVAMIGALAARKETTGPKETAHDEKPPSGKTSATP